MAMQMAGTSGGGRRRGGRRAPMADINVTPLVDVMLVLLIIFMVTAPMLTAGVPVELPDSRADALEPEPDQITISIANDGRIFLNDDELEPGTLDVALANLPRGQAGKPPLIMLRADRGLEYGLVMGVMGELNRSGFNSISLVTNSSVNAP